MLDLGASFVASVGRDPDAIAIVDGGIRLSYQAWYKSVSAVAGAMEAAGLRRGDHLLTLLQNRWEAATLHWACQFAGVVITPVNWRATVEELEFLVKDSGARVVAFEPVSAAAVEGSPACQHLRRFTIGMPPGAVGLDFTRLLAREAPLARPHGDPDAWSAMLYTSGKTAQPKGVPRRHRTERAAAAAHVAQNLFHSGERTLGAIPLYHPMGVRSLLAMSLVGGTFVCLQRFDAASALAAIERERVTSLYFVPTLYLDLVQHPDRPKRDLSSVRKLGFTGASMTDGLAKALVQAFQPDLFVNHYGSSEAGALAINQKAAEKPGSAGRAAINQMIRIVKFEAETADNLETPGQEGEIVALAAGDEVFEGYWNRPDADALALRDGWYFTGDSGYVDGEGDIVVTGRVDDMIITGGEKLFPLEIESLLSRHPAVAEVAVAGLADPRWGRIVAAFVKRRAMVTVDALDEHCRVSGLANFKRPRRYVFVDELPKSPAGKVLRRKLVSGEYVPEAAPPA